MAKGHLGEEEEGGSIPTASLTLDFLGSWQTVVSVSPEVLTCTWGGCR